VDAQGRLIRIAAAQHGLVTADQAVHAGLSTEQIRYLTRSGRWIALRPKVYAVAGAPPTEFQAMAAAVFAAGPQAWASHATAGALWQFPRVHGATIEVVTPLDRKVGLFGVSGHRSGRLFTDDLSLHRRIPTTSPERTLIDLSGRLSEAELAHILDDGLRRGVLRLARLSRCAGRLAGAPKRRPSAIQALLAERCPGYDPGDSDLETRVLRLLVAGGFPPPVQQFRLRLGSRTVRLDLAHPQVMLAMELDGWEHHRARTAFDDDRARGNLIVAAGWTLVRFTSRTSEAGIIGCVRAVWDRFGKSGASGRTGSTKRSARVSYVSPAWDSAMTTSPRALGPSR
jgi:hypothetical protein